MAESADSFHQPSNFSDNAERLRHLYDVDPALVFVKDRQGQFVFANKALANIYGTTVEDLQGKTDADFNPDIGEIEHFLCHDIQVMNNREELFIAEEHVTDHAGNGVWLQTTKRPVIDADDKCDHVLGVSFDITARKQAEFRERELQSRLAQAQRMESLGVMAGGIAHDLNNILGPLVAYPELIQRRIGNDDPTTRQLLSDMTEAASRATEVIQDLLTLARRGNYDLQPININDVVTEYLRSPGLRRLQSERPAVYLQTDLAADLPPALGSAPHFYQVVMNLVTNAFEAMNNGGQLTIATRGEKLEQSFTAHAEIAKGDYVILEVTDTGQGIPPEQLSSVFEPFVSSKVLGRSGSGLGLAVVFGAIQDMQGYIDVHSKPGEGARFRVRLPSLAHYHTEPEAADVMALTGTGTILIIDDLVSQRNLGSRVLEALGYQVLVAANCADALKTLSASPTIDLVLIDMLMPQSPDGLDTFRAIQQIRPGLPCIIVSGNGENDRIRTARMEGVLALVRKPYTQQVMSQAIRMALGSESD